jgi:hypothetical protein
MKKIILSLFGILSTSFLLAQAEKAAFTETGRGAVNAFVTDYHALGINPANLAYGNEYKKKYTLGFAQASLSNYGEGFTRSELWGAITGVDDNLPIADQFDAAERFANTVLSLDANVLLLGFSVNTESAGNFAFSIGTRFSHFSVFNETGSDHLWLGYVDPYFDRWVVAGNGGNDTIANGGANSPQVDDVILGLSSNPQFATALYNNTTVRSMSYTEYNLGYGRTVYENDDFRINAGVGLKYLQGLYVLNLVVAENQVVNAFTASTPALDIDYGSASLTNPSAVDGTGLKPVGTGFGFDFGVAMELNDQFRFSASVTDIGSITFDGNVYSSADTLVYDMETQGLDGYNFFNQLDVFAGDDGLFQWNGLEKQKLNLPTQLRMGLAYFTTEKIRLGLDLAFPMNDEPGNIDRMSFAMGGEYLVSDGFRISAGFAAGENYEFRIPIGFNFIGKEGAWEAGIASRDVLYFLRDVRPNLSLAMGFLRFRFGTMEKGIQSRLFN